MTWSGFAALQKDVGYAGTTPLKSFFKNSATSSMHSFQTTADAPPCDGIVAANAKPGNVLFLPAVKSISPKPVRQTITPPPPDPSFTTPDNFNDPYYPHMIGGARRATYCPADGNGGYNCSTVPPCANGAAAEERCGVVVLDHYTSSFHWAQGNVSAIWLRPQWYLMDNSVLTDVQNGGYTIISGGDYTHSSLITGYWGLARNIVFAGHTRDNTKYPYASNIGPFNGTSKLKCDPVVAPVGVPAYCLSSPEGISMPFGGFFTNQRLANIYDGPSYQDFECLSRRHDGGLQHQRLQQRMHVRDRQSLPALEKNPRRFELRLLSATRRNRLETAQRLLLPTRVSLRQSAVR